MRRLLRIGTRGSKLALAQAGEAKGALERKIPDLTCELVILKTTGDDFTQGLSPSGLPAGSVAGIARGQSLLGTVPLKGLFVKEIEEALLEGRIELAVHSVKDLQTELPEGLTLAAILPRQDPRDALVTRKGETFDRLPAGSSVGASSLRRQSQLKRIRRDLEFVAIRGNVDTRLRKLDAGECGALVLAACGLIRLGLSKRIGQLLDPDTQVVPAAGQGALGIEMRADREELIPFVRALNDPAAHSEVQAERACLKALGGGCQVPVGVWAKVQGEGLTVIGIVLSPDGLKAVRKTISGPRQAAQRLGTELASHLRAAGADRLLFGQWASKGGSKS